jgi:hypothetical protein
MASYASKNFNEDLPPLDAEISVNGVKGVKKVRVWCIDELHTNPYELSLRENYGATPTETQIDLMRKEGTLTPVAEYEKDFDADSTVRVNCTNNGLVLVEIM